MSQPFSRYLHPFDVAHHPSLEPEVKRSILASLVSDQNAVKNHEAMLKISELDCQVPVDDVFAALRPLDNPDSELTLQ